jgi:hypothetical protein
MQKPTPVSAYLPAAFILALVGWGGLAVLILKTVPTVGPRWMFFFLIVLALTGTFLPAVAFLNRRFPTNPPAAPAAIIREAIWFSVYASTLTWLRWGGALTLALALLIASGFIAIEVLLRMRERSQWRP